MKKLCKGVSLLLAGALLMASLAACQKKPAGETTAQEQTTKGTEAVQTTQGNTKDSGEESAFAGQTLEVAAFAGAYGTDFCDSVCAKFEDEYDVKVELTCSPQLGDIIRPSVVSGDPPDFIAFAQEQDIITTMIKEDALLDLSDVVGEFKDTLLDGILDYCQPYKDGRILYTPSWYYSWGTWYNKGLFEEKNWELPKTFDEMLALGEKAKQEGMALFVYPGVYPGYNQGVLFAALASAGGADLLNAIANYEEGVWEKPEVKEVLDFYQKMVDNGYILDGSVALTHTQAQTEFVQGKAVFCVSGSWIETEMADAAPEGFRYGFLPTPTAQAGQQQYANIGFETFEIPAAAKNPELAKEFLKFLYRQDNLLMNAEKTQACMAIKGGADMVKEYMTESNYENLKMLDSELMPCFVNWTLTEKTEITIMDELFNSINSLVNKEMDVDGWIARMEEDDAVLREAVAK